MVEGEAVDNRELPDVGGKEVMFASHIWCSMYCRAAPSGEHYYCQMWCNIVHMEMLVKAVLHRNAEDACGSV